MRTLESATGMTVEHFEHVGFVILRAKRNQDSALEQVQHGGVKIRIHLARILHAVELDPVDTVFADDPSPQGVIAVEDQALLGTSFERASNAGKLPGISIEKGAAERGPQR